MEFAWLVIVVAFTTFVPLLCFSYALAYFVIGVVLTNRRIDRLKCIARALTAFVLWQVWIALSELRRLDADDGNLFTLFLHLVLAVLSYRILERKLFKYIQGLE